MVWRRLQAERARGRAYQPRFAHHEVLFAWLGGLLAITALGLISTWSHYPLVVAPFGASTVLLFGNPSSPLAQPRNLVAGNTLRALLGGLLQARPAFVLVPILSRSLLLVAMAVLFSRLQRSEQPYPHHWL